MGLGLALKKHTKKLIDSPEDKKIFNKLVKKAKKKGVDIVVGGSNSSDVANSLRSNDFDVKLLKKLKMKKIKDRLNKKHSYNIDALDNTIDHIRIGKDMSSASILSHELGHLHREKGAKDLLNKGSQVGKKITTISPLVGLATGIKAGIDEEKSGKKEGKLSRYGGTILSALGSIPTLAEESRASINGYKLLKKMGASQDLLKKSKQNLLIAGGTYLTNAAVRALATDVMHTGAKYASKKLYKKLKKKLDNDNTKTE